MSEPRAQRTLVKSPPELWAEVSDVSTLARHLGEFGEIRITRLEAETTVVWEGDRARGTVNLEPSGWGTKVTITAEAIAVEAIAAEAEAVAVAEPEPEPVVEPEPEPVAVAEPEPVAVAAADPARKRRLFARWFARKEKAEPIAEPVAIEAPEPVVPEPEAEPVPEPVAVVEPVAVAAPAFDDDRVEAVLVSVLDDLGSAHHRPFSRG
jgi:hypothetical protein